MKHHFEIRKSIHSPILHGTIYEPETVFGLVLFVHDVNENRFRYEAVADYFNERSMTFVTYDLRGHHKSLIHDKKGHFGDDEGAATLLEDTLEVIDLLKKRYPYIPLTLMGQGVGAYLAMLAFDHNPDLIEHLILINPNSLPKFAKIKLQLLNLMTYRQPALVKPALFKWMGVTIPSKSEKQRYSFLSHNPDIINKYLLDPFCGYQLSQRAIRDVLEIELAALSSNIESSNKEVKVSILGGKDDPLTHFGRDLVGLKKRFIQSGYDLTTLTIFDRLKHDVLLEVSDHLHLEQLLETICFQKI